jgi:hypothetical protein
VKGRGVVGGAAHAQPSALGWQGPCCDTSWPTAPLAGPTAPVSAGCGPCGPLAHKHRQQPVASGLQQAQVQVRSMGMHLVSCMQNGTCMLHLRRCYVMLCFDRAMPCCCPCMHACCIVCAHTCLGTWCCPYCGTPPTGMGVSPPTRTLWWHLACACSALYQPQSADLSWPPTQLSTDDLASDPAGY